MSSEKEIYKAKSVHCDEDHVTFEREERDQLRITATMYPWPVNDEPRKPDVISIVVDGDDATEIACEIMNAYQVENITETQQKATIEALRRRVAELEEQAQRDDSATYHLSQMVKSLTAENAELKRRVAELEGENKSYAEAYDLEISERRKYEAEATRLTAENAELKAKLSAVNDLIDTYDSIELEYEKQHCIWNCLCDGVYFAIGATKEDAFHNAARATANCGEQSLSEIQAVHDAILRGDD